jgi:hypothetical protein
MEPSTNAAADAEFEPDSPSHLFLLRVRHCPGAAKDWCGWVQHPATGERHTFRSCAELRRAVQRMIIRTRPGGSAEDPDQ